VPSGWSDILLSVMKTAERDEARRLRRDEGLSIREITRRLGVSRSSVSLWVRDVPLTPEQRERLRAQNPRFGGQNLGAAANALRARQRRMQWHEDGRAMARTGDAAFAAGCMLYWAEGSKTRNVAQLSNSDPRSCGSSSTSCAATSAFETRTAA